MIPTGCTTMKSGLSEVIPMPIKLHFNRHATEARVMGAFKAGLSVLAGEIRDDCNEYCKMDTEMLIASSMVHSRLDQGLIIWQTPYARRQYWEIRTAYTDENPKATWRWCEYAKQAYKDKWARQAEILTRRHL